MSESKVTEEPEALPPLAGEKAVKLYKQGFEAWKQWAEKPKNKGRKVYFSTASFARGDSFEGYIFPGDVDFSKANFKGDANFNEVTFAGKAMFNNANFSGDANFSKTTFTGSAQFDKTTFRGRAEFDIATFLANADFPEAIFTDYASFHKATFTGRGWFNSATFQGGVGFDESIFKDNAGFDDSTFTGSARFDGTTFSGRASFTGSLFNGTTSLEGGQFKIPPDFRRTQFSKHLTLHGIEVSLPHAIEADDADKFRRLKQLAVDARDHDREQMFFANELIAKRGFETEGPALIGSYLYEWFSNFGRSIMRPFIALMFAWVFSAMYFSHPWFNFRLIESDVVAKSASFLFPFLGAARTHLTDKMEGADLFIGFALGGIGVICLFLIGLALRNRFRI